MISALYEDNNTIENPTCRVILKMVLSVLSSQVSNDCTPLPAPLAGREDSGSDNLAFLAIEASLELSEIPCIGGVLAVEAVVGLLDCGVTEPFSSSNLSLFVSFTCDDCSEPEDCSDCV